MIKNGTIRKYVTERIKPYRAKVFGYTLLYGLITMPIASAIGAVVGIVIGLLGALGAIVLALITKSLGVDVTIVAAAVTMISRTISLFVILFTSVFMYVCLVGFTKEILLCVNEKNQVTPIDFFKLGFSDFKRCIYVQLRLLLKKLPSIILCLIGTILGSVGLVLPGDNAAGIILTVIGILVLLIGLIWMLSITLLYQTTTYELIYDGKELSAKEILSKARESIKGYVWKWTRLNYYYSFIIAIIMIAVVTLFTFGIGVAIMITQSAGNGAAAVAMIVSLIAVAIMIGITILLALLGSYFNSKNILNLDELYKVILKEKGVNMDVPVSEEQ